MTRSLRPSAVARRRLGLAALAAAVAATLSACAGLPTSGPVQQGLTAVDAAERPDTRYLPEDPPLGASPDEIVAGFLLAGAGPSRSGPVDRWETARKYLDGSIRNTWKPAARVTVGTVHLIEPSSTPTPGKRVTLQYDVDKVATVDENGTYAVSAGERGELSFALVREKDGEWRISKAPDGIVLDPVTFATVFRHYSLMYWDSSHTHLVPDVRWFPKTNPASRIAQALVQGPPSSWLTQSVKSDFPPNAQVSLVRINKGTAEVDLDGFDPGEVGGSALNRMLTQLTSSLLSAGYSDVRMTNRSAVIPATLVTPEPEAAVPPLALTPKGFGLYTGQEMRALKPLDAAVKAAKPDAIEVLNPNANAPIAAVHQSGTGHVGVIQGGKELLRLDTRPGLVAPTVDANGFVWSVPRMAPQGVQAYDVTGKRFDVGHAWPGASRIDAMQVSRDGTRVAAIILVGGRTALAVAGIVRDADGAPRSLSDPLVMDGLPGTGVDLAWIDEATLGALARDGEAVTLVQQTVGGMPDQFDVPENAVGIAGGTSASSLRLRDSGGIIYERRNSNWDKVAQGVTVLAKVQ